MLLALSVSAKWPLDPIVECSSIVPDDKGKSVACLITYACPCMIVYRLIFKSLMCDHLKTDSFLSSVIILIVILLKTIKLQQLSLF
jgi:hypothetical protein